MLFFPRRLALFLRAEAAADDASLLGIQEATVPRPWDRPPVHSWRGKGFKVPPEEAWRHWERMPWRRAAISLSCQLDRFRKSAFPSPSSSQVQALPDLAQNVRPLLQDVPPLRGRERENMHLGRLPLSRNGSREPVAEEGAPAETKQAGRQAGKAGEAGGRSMQSKGCRRAVLERQEFGCQGFWPDLSCLRRRCRAANGMSWELAMCGNTWCHLRSPSHHVSIHTRASSQSPAPSPSFPSSGPVDWFVAS